MSFLKILNDWFWSPSFWLLPGVTWDDIKSTETIIMPHPVDLLFSFIITIFLIVLRYCVIVPYMIRPVGLYFGIRNVKRKGPVRNNQLESIYIAYKTIRPPREVIIECSRDLGINELQVESWLRQRSRSVKPTPLFKFCDNVWQFLYHACYTLFGIWVLCDKSWLWDIKQCWYEYPYHNLSDSLWWYYMIPLGFYCASILSFVFQHQRKDAAQMLLHHIITVILISSSWVINMTRIGSLILLLHEGTDIPLLLCKICDQTKQLFLKEILFYIFAFLWIITRIILYPCWVLRSVLVDTDVLFQKEPGYVYPFYYIFQFLLFSLLGFHTVWTYFIFKVVQRKLVTSEIKDSRSDSEMMTDSDDEVRGQPSVVKLLQDKKKLQ